jgi:hypothetical protein
MIILSVEHFQDFVIDHVVVFLAVVIDHVVAFLAVVIDIPDLIDEF